MVVVRADDGALRDDLIIPQGSQWNRSWAITDAAGNPLTLGSGWSARSQIRASATAPVVLFEWNTVPGVGIGVVTAFGTSVQINLTGNADSASWAFRSGVYDVYLVDPAGRPTRIVEGSVRVTPSVTR